MLTLDEKLMTINKIMFNMNSDPKVKTESSNNGMEFKWLKSLKSGMESAIASKDESVKENLLSEIKQAAQLYALTHSTMHDTERGTERFNYAMAILEIADFNLAGHVAKSAEKDAMIYDQGYVDFDKLDSDPPLKVDLKNIYFTYVEQPLKSSNVSEENRAEFVIENINKKVVKEDVEEVVEEREMSERELEIRAQMAIGEATKSEAKSRAKQNAEPGVLEKLQLMGDVLTKDLDFVFKINSQEYKDVIAVANDANKLLDHGIDLNDREMDAFKKHSAEVVKKYLDTHSTERKSPMGERRFIAVLSMLDTLEPDGAYKYLETHKTHYNDLHGAKLEQELADINTSYRGTYFAHVLGNESDDSLMARKRGLAAIKKSLSQRTKNIENKITTEFLKKEKRIIKFSGYPDSRFNECRDFTRLKVIDTLLNNSKGEYMVYSKESYDKAMNYAEDLAHKMAENPKNKNNDLAKALEDAIKETKSTGVNEIDAGMGKNTPKLENPEILGPHA